MFKAYMRATQDSKVQRVSSRETRGARHSGVLLIRRWRSNVIKRLSSTFDLWVLCLMQRIMVLSTMQCRVSLRLWIPLQRSKTCLIWTWRELVSVVESAKKSAAALGARGNANIRPADVCSRFGPRGKPHQSAADLCGWRCTW